MDGRVGKGIITLFLCLVVLSSLLFIFFETNRCAPTAEAVDFGSAGQISEPARAEIVELVDPWVFTGVMEDYDYDLYRSSADGYEYVAPPALDYADSSTLDALSLGELGVATDEIDPASRETTINLTMSRKPPATPTPEATPDVSPGQLSVLSFYLTPATKTVILDGGASTATVQILPDAIDAYLAVRDPDENLVFISSFSNTRQAYSRTPVPIVRNSPITKLYGTIFTWRMDSRNIPGHYEIKAVLVPPGANVLDTNNWISNLCEKPFNYAIVAE